MNISPLKMIQPVISRAGNAIQRGCKKVANSRLMIKHSDMYTAKKAGAYVAGFGVASIVTKDALGCYYYVTQSLKNEKIPEDKRKFVAALDLANGALMIATQIALTLTLVKVQKKLFKKFFGKHFNANAVAKMADKLSPELKAGLSPQKGLKEVKKVMKKYKNEVFSGFSVITSLVAASIIAKRAIVPFLSTPLASVVKDKFLEKGDNNKIDLEKYQQLSQDRLMSIYFKNNQNMEQLYSKMHNKK